MNEYQKIDPIYNITGYIVNIFDQVNYDIDLYIPSEDKDKYDNVIKKKYTFIDIDNSSQIQTRYAYRCRLRGIYMDREKQSNIKLNKDSMRDVIEFFTRCNNWVIITISDIDIYRRGLIDIYDPLRKTSLKTYLLQGSYNSIFKDYNSSNLSYGSRSFPKTNNNNNTSSQSEPIITNSKFSYESSKNSNDSDNSDNSNNSNNSNNSKNEFIPVRRFKRRHYKSKNYFPEIESLRIPHTDRRSDYNIRMIEVEIPPYAKSYQDK